MAYQPVSGNKKQAGYQPVSKKKQTYSGMLDSAFPHRQMLRDASKPVPVQVPRKRQTMGETRTQLRDMGLDVPFAATRTGMAVGTAKAIPKNIGRVAQGFARGVASTISTPATALETYKASKEAGEFTPAGPTFDPNRSALSRTVFGDKEFSAYSEAADLQDIFRTEENQGKFTPGTAAIGLGLAAADIPTGGGASATFKTIFKNLAKSQKLARTTKSLDDAVVILKKAGVSDDVIKRYDLGKKVVDANDDASIAAVFREAATGESVARKGPYKPVTKGRQAQPSSVARTADEVVETPVVRSDSPDTPMTPVRSADDATSIAQDVVRTKNAQQAKVLDAADEARYIEDQVLPKTAFGVADVTRVEGGTIPTVKLSQLAKNSLENNKSGIRSNSIKEQSTNLKKGEVPERPVEVRVIEDGSIDIVDGRHILEAARQNGIENVRIKDVTSEFFPDGVEIVSRTPINQLPRLPRTPRNTDNPDAVIQTGMQKYEATPSPAQGDTLMAKMAEKAPSLGAKRLTGELLTPISSRLGRINPKLKYKLRNFEFRTRDITQQRLQKALPLFEATKKMSPNDRAVFDLAQKNGDADVLDAITQKYGLQKEMAEARQVLDEIIDDANKVGLDVPYRGDYFPRQVKNPSEFSQYLRGRKDWGEIKKQITIKAEEKGVKYTDLTEEELSSIANNLLRGYGNQVTLAGPGATKARTIETIGSDLNRFYENSNTAFLTYIHKMTDEIEGRRFFGKEIRGEVITTNPNTKEVVAFNTQDSIGAYVMKLVSDGDITALQEEEVTKILQSRFKKGSMNGLVAAYRDLEYISTMGNPISAITQIGDLAFSAYKNGYYNTLKGVGGTIARKNQMTKESLGIERIGQEFDNPTKTSKALEKVFKYVGMEQIDRLGKETFLEGSRLKLTKLAQKQDDKLVSDLYYMFDDVDAARTLEELRQGAITQRTKEVHFNRLLDIQPLAKSEMPQKYLEAPNGRIFYMLKSFTLKQFDIFRREALDKMVSGTAKERVEATQNFLRLSAAFMLANATADEIKDFILGRDTPPSDRVVDNLYRLAGASKYDIYNSRERGVGFAVLQRLLPPASIADRIGRDVYNIKEDKTYERGPLEGEKYKSEAVQSIPGGGKLYYWWFGRGDQKEDYKDGVEESGTTTSGLPALPKLPSAGGAGLPTLPTLPKLP